jgi:hypothetical protein
MMLLGRAADVPSVLPRLLAAVSSICCVLVLASFVLFAHDQMAGASQRQQTAELPGGAQVFAAPPAPPHKHAQPRRFIDGAANALTSPFRSVIQSSNDWVNHGIPAVLALVVYGLGLGYLARFSRGFA